MARILVIEDEDNIRTMVRLALEHVKHKVTAAPSGLEGVRLFGDGGDFDLVLLDQRLPDIMGIEVLDRLRARDSDAWVIMMTAVGTLELAEEAAQAGASDFLRKPFTVETLRGAVDAALKGTKPLQKQQQAQAKSSVPILGTMTLNGFRIESRAASSLPPPQPNFLDRILHRAAAAGPGIRTADYLRHDFLVRNPGGEVRECAVLLPASVAAEIQARAGSDNLPGGERFWQALSEETLSNYLWQNADFPPDQTLRLLTVTPGMERWVDNVLAVAAAAGEH